MQDAFQTRSLPGRGKEAQDEGASFEHNRLRVPSAALLTNLNEATKEESSTHPEHRSAAKLTGVCEGDSQDEVGLRV